MLPAFLYFVEGEAAGAHFGDPDSWYWGGAESQGTAYRMLRTIWWSPAAVELFRPIPARDPAD